MNSVFTAWLTTPATRSSSASSRDGLAQQGTHITVELPLVTPVQNGTTNGGEEIAPQGG